MIHVMATIHFQPQHFDAVKKTMLELAKQSRTETGCLRYEVFQRTDAPLLVTQETWMDELSEKAHMAGPYIAAAFAQIGSFLTSAPDIHYYTQWI